jgi:hypothetical protein
MKDQTNSIAAKKQNNQKLPLCREPWESYYILRRGILPCCYGEPIYYDMSDWKKAWNSRKMQKIRRYLSQGKLSPYCQSCIGCPIVQRYLMNKKGQSYGAFVSLYKNPLILRIINRMFFKIPGKIYTHFKKIK